MALGGGLKKGIIQYVKFNIIAISNGVVDLAALNLLLLLWPTDQDGLLLLFNTIAYGLAVLNSYIWNVRFTFHAEGDSRQKVLFILQGLVSLGISDLTFIGANEVLSGISAPNWITSNLAKGLSMFFSSTASFIFMKWIVFRNTQRN